MNYVLISGSHDMKLYSPIITFLKSKKIKFPVISFVAASFNEYNLNDKMKIKLEKEFNKNDFYFKKSYMIDCRISNEIMKQYLIKSDIIFLLGGNTLEQIKCISKYNLKKIIRKKIVIGMSAGAINMAKKVILAKDVDDNIPELSIYNGIGITDINIEPHCDFLNKTHWNDLEEASMYSEIIVMNDDAYIICDSGVINFYGKYIKLNKKEITWNDKKSTLNEFLKGIQYD